MVAIPFCKRTAEVTIGGNRTHYLPLLAGALSGELQISIASTNR